MLILRTPATGDSIGRASRSQWFPYQCRKTGTVFFGSQRFAARLSLFDFEADKFPHENPLLFRPNADEESFNAGFRIPIDTLLELIAQSIELMKLGNRHLVPFFIEFDQPFPLTFSPAELASGARRTDASLIESRQTAVWLIPPPDHSHPPQLNC